MRPTPPDTSPETGLKVLNGSAWAVPGQSENGSLVHHDVCGCTRCYRTLPGFSSLRCHLQKVSQVSQAAGLCVKWCRFSSSTELQTHWCCRTQTLRNHRQHHHLLADSSCDLRPQAFLRWLDGKKTTLKRNSRSEHVEPGQTKCRLADGKRTDETLGASGLILGGRRWGRVR